MALSKRAFVIGLTLIGGLYGTVNPVHADTLLIEGMDAAEPTTTERPRRGTSMASVEARFGPPATRSSAIGQPPITRWDYPNFAVFFEFDHVVHSVRR